MAIGEIGKELQTYLALVVQFTEFNEECRKICAEMAEENSQAKIFPKSKKDDSGLQRKYLDAEKHRQSAHEAMQNYFYDHLKDIARQSENLISVKA